MKKEILTSSFRNGDIKRLQRFQKPGAVLAKKLLNRKPCNISLPKIKNLLLNKDYMSLKEQLKNHLCNDEIIIFLISSDAPDDALMPILNKKLSNDVQLALLKHNRLRLIKQYARRHLVIKEILREQIIHANEEFLLEYIKRHRLPEDNECDLICSHLVALIEFYIKKHGFSSKGQLEFLSFMKERTLR